MFGVCFCGKHTKPCCHATTAHLISRQSLASIINKNPKILTKRLFVATAVASVGRNTIIG